MGWHDHFCKTFVCNAGSSDLGEPAKKKRQRDDGSNFYKCVNRPEALQRFYEACGAIDQHNRHRQHLLKLEKTWQTKRWQTRVLYSVVVGMVTVDAHLMCAHVLPDRHSDSKESMARFVAKLTAQMMPEHVPRAPTASPAASLVSTCATSSDPGPGCHLEKIGRKLIVDGKNAGKFRPGDGRCKMRIKAKRRGKDGRAPKTMWRCALHPDIPLCSNQNCN